MKHKHAVGNIGKNHRKQPRDRVGNQRRYSHDGIRQLKCHNIDDRSTYAKEEIGKHFPFDKLHDFLYHRVVFSDLHERDSPLT